MNNLNLSGDIEMLLENTLFGVVYKIDDAIFLFNDELF